LRNWKILSEHAEFSESKPNLNFNFETNQPTNKHTIEQTLVLNGVVYDDIKLELLDHIATEIESLIDEVLSFEEN
jgi:hypothetical protein